MDELNNPSPTFRIGVPMGKPADTELSKLTVLIVDDEPMLRSVIQDFLSMLGITNQRVAGDGIEALEVIRSEPIDFMLSDIRMPKMELEELLGVIKKEFPRLVVVATSGFSDLESARNIFVRGAHDFIGKPLNLDALELAIQWIIERRRVLAKAEGLFGRAALPLAPEEGRARLETLKKTLHTGIHHFEGKINHSIRMAEFIARVETGLEENWFIDLQLAALLHEMGTGCQIQALCRQARTLDEDERRLVQEHAPTSGRLISCTLERPEFQTIIGQHLSWQITMGIPAENMSLLERMSVWLGLVNSVDGYLHDRPDRTAIMPKQVFGILNRKFKNPGGTPVGVLLAQWDRVESFFRQD